MTAHQYFHIAPIHLTKVRNKHLLSNHTQSEKESPMIYFPSDNKLWNNIFSLMLLNENRITRKDIIKAFGEKSNSSIKRLIDLKILKTKTGIKPHLLFLTAKGKEHIKKNANLPDEIMSLIRPQKLSYKESDVIRVARKSQILTDMYLNEIAISDTLTFSEAPLFVPPIFLNNQINNKNDHKLGVVCKGVLTNNNTYYGIYTTLYGNQIIFPNIESLTTTEIKDKLFENTGLSNPNKAKIIFDNNLDGIAKIIKNEEYFENQRRKDDRVRPSRHTFDCVWGNTFYIPSGEASRKHLQAILGDTSKIINDIKINNNLPIDANIFFPYGTGMMKLMTKTTSPIVIYMPKEDINNLRVLLKPIDI